MKKTARISLDIKEPLANALVDAFLSCGSNTRTMAAKACKVSLTTSGKLANLLVSSSYFVERLDRAEISGQRRCRHLYLSSSVSVVVIDMSSPRYTLSVVEGEHKLIYSRSYDYDPNLDFESNLTVFLSRTAMGMPYKKGGLMHICVILSDEKTAKTAQAYLPREIDKTRIQEVISTAFGKAPALFVREADAFSAAVRYGIGKTKNCSVCYLRADAPQSLLFTSDKVTISRDLGSLLTDRGALQSINIDLLTREERETILSRLVNFAFVAYSPDLIMLGSQRSNIDDSTVKAIRYKLASLGAGYPVIKLCSDAEDLRILGAARATVKQAIKRLFK